MLSLLSWCEIYILYVNIVLTFLLLGAGQLSNEFAIEQRMSIVGRNAVCSSMIYHGASCVTIVLAVLACV
jgi:hypothetical protein